MVVMKLISAWVMKAVMVVIMLIGIAWSLTNDCRRCACIACGGGGGRDGDEWNGGSGRNDPST